MAKINYQKTERCKNVAEPEPEPEPEPDSNDGSNSEDADSSNYELIS